MYVLHRFKESHEDCRKFVEQIQTLPARVAAMKSRHANKRAAANVPLMQDEMTQQEEEHGNRSPQENDAALRHSLMAVFASEGINNNKDQNKVVSEYVANKLLNNTTKLV